MKPKAGSLGENTSNSNNKIDKPLGRLTKKKERCKLQFFKFSVSVKLYQMVSLKKIQGETFTLKMIVLGTSKYLQNCLPW